MMWIVGLLCILAVFILLVSMVIVAIGMLVEFVKPYRKPTPREKAEMENTEFDYGHNVKNYREEDYE